MPLRIIASFPCRNAADFKSRLLHWIKNQEVAAFYDSNHFSSLPGITGQPYDWIAAAGVKQELTAGKHFLSGLETLEGIRDWKFGLLSYDLKNETEKLTSANNDSLDFPAGYFFIPEVVIFCRKDVITIAIHEKKAEGVSPEWLFNHICGFDPYPLQAPAGLAFSQRTGWQSYLEHAASLGFHIRRGDIYEVNYCLEFYAAAIQVDPVSLFLLLNRHVPSPFAAYFRIGQRYIMGASPERFLRREGEKLISQPMKGTVPRGVTREEDEVMKKELMNSEKEQAENVMIVDLVRNDLSRIAGKGSVKVEELFGVYSYPRVHQMISTVSCSVSSGKTFAEIIRATFPMGSMTGAPKVRAMELIEAHEEMKRGAFSGAVGYMDPDGNFDFNVVIRSFLYNEEKKYLSVMAGSALTSQAHPEKEYAECLLKAGYVIEAIGGKLEMDESAPAVAKKN